jgi:hypothetical protein
MALVPLSESIAIKIGHMTKAPSRIKESTDGRPPAAPGDASALGMPSSVAISKAE